MRAYAVVRTLADLLLRAYFRQVSVVGLENVAPTGPLIFAANHPNALVDPLLVLTAAPRPIRFAAKDTLFSAAWIRPVLWALKAVPIRRRQDHGGAGIDNAAAFRALHDALHNGECVGIFPEGISHDQAMLARLKTGTARIALATQAENPNTGVQLVPCGLIYLSRTRFRARALVQFGRPLRIDADLLEHYRRDEQGAVVALTVRLEDALRALTVNAGDWETLRVLDTVRRMFQPPRLDLPARIELSRRFAQAYTEVRNHPEIVALRRDVVAYQQGLRELGLRDADIADPQGLGRALAKAARQSFLFAIWFVLGLPGVVVHAPVLIFATLVDRWIARSHGDLRATAKLVAAMVATALVYVAVLTLAFWQGGLLTGLGWLIAMPLVGVASLNLLDRQLAWRRLVQALRRITTHGRTVVELRAQRQHLQEAIAACISRELPDAAALLEPVRASTTREV